MTKKYRLCAGAAALLILCGFGAYRFKRIASLDDPAITALRTEVEGALKRAVEKKQDLLQVNDVRVTRTEPADREGSVAMTYHLSFDTRGEGGQVTHESDSVAILDRAGESTWDVRSSAPLGESLVFHQGMEISGKAGRETASN